MFETVSVDDALARGQRMVNYPVFAIMIGSVALSMVLVLGFSAPDWIYAIGIPGAFVFPWLYWSFAITRWRLWAFENVRNVHELHSRAIKEQLIWPAGNFFEKTEIRTRADKARWAEILNKFDREDIFNDDYGVPTETVISFSKNKKIGDIIALVAVMAGGVYLLLETDKVYYGWLGVLGPIAYFILNLKSYKNKGAQVIINNVGIETDGSVFTPWEQIIGEDVIREGHGKSTTFYFSYRTTSGVFVKLDILNFDISKKQIEKLLRVYRGRFEKKNSRFR